MTLSSLDRFLGDSPLRVLIKLVVISFLVGVVMHAFGWSPFDVLFHQAAGYILRSAATLKT